MGNLMDLIRVKILQNLLNFTDDEILIECGRGREDVMLHIELLNYKIENEIKLKEEKISEIVEQINIDILMLRSLLSFTDDEILIEFGCGREEVMIHLELLNSKVEDLMKLKEISL